MFIVSKLAQRNANPAKRHWEAAIRVLQYLYGTQDYSHTIRAGSSWRVTIYIDASYGVGENGRSQTGTVTCIGDIAIGWSSCKQEVVALSSTEAEYIAMTVAAQEAAWLKMLLEEIGEKIIPVVVTDNEGAKKLTENPIFHRRTKHIQIRFHYIRELLKEGKLEVKWVAGKDNRADLLTKQVVGPQLQRLTELVLQKNDRDDESLSEGECWNLE
jgi:hypothetical protein